MQHVWELGGGGKCMWGFGGEIARDQLRKQQRILPVSCLNISLYVLYSVDEKLQATAWHSYSLSV